jgi:rhamnulokinase
LPDLACLAFDLGAETGRAVVGRYDGASVELEELRRFPTPSAQLPDGLYWDALGLYAQLLAGLGEARAHGVTSVGIDSWAVDFGLLDSRGALVRNPLSYRDGRGAGAMEHLLRDVPPEEIYAVTGIQFLPFNTLFQLLALREEGVLERAETLLLLPDLLAFWLTGARGAERTNASTTQLLDARSGTWATELVRRVGLPERILAPLVDAGSRVGALLPHVAEETGLTAEVVAVASHDTASAVVATPLAGEHAAYISSGTWSLVGVETAAPVLSADARLANHTNERGFGGTTRLLKNVMGLWLLQECRRSWLRDGETASYAELAQLAAGEPGGIVFDPDAPALLAPGDMPARIADACGRSLERPALVRAIFESLACKYRAVVEDLEAATGRSIEVIHVVGGGASNTVLCTLTANVCGRPVVPGPVEATALGNVLVQLHAQGELASLEDMRRIVTSSSQAAPIEPERSDRWDVLYERFTQLETEVLAR